MYRVKEMSATDGLPASTKKPLPRFPTFVDFIRGRMKWLYYHSTVQKLEGYHFGILCCAVASAVVMVINLILTIWALKHYEVQDGLGTIRDGSCSEVKKIAMWTHLGINILSTLLLGASNYTMQCLSSPTCEDINKAHSRRVWLDIGTPSVRNLLSIPRTRMLLWWLLAISSAPLHLIYNSAIFTTMSAREYNAFLVQLNFLNGAPFNISAFSTFSTFSGEESDFDVISGTLNQVETIAHALQDGQSSLQKLANKDCIGTYAAEFVSSHANVLAVASNPNGDPRLDPNRDEDSILQVWWSPDQGTSDDFPWFCGDKPCDTKMIAEAATWKLVGWNVHYCLSQVVEEHCKVQFSGAIMVVVLVCNLCKMIVMGYIALERPSEPLVTVGDAIASFLNQPDVTTIGNCMAGKDQFENVNISSPALSNWSERITRYDLRTSYWFRAVSMRRWILLLVL